MEIAKISEPNSSGSEEKYIIGNTDWKVWNKITEKRFKEWIEATDRKKWE